ncbi:hypothetical protein BD626DRAFT_473779 [Schizophyllum amplum]|uniref:Uncharacterized protein n=1 Tax=Schizophyllum amplum TaxID=97359 RepID=A0A550CX76_9AGAR|nr:hypothetical protein BD626DRAFT_473779 [Auriculariopsis ampla]
MHARRALWTPRCADTYGSWPYALVQGRVEVEHGVWPIVSSGMRATSKRARLASGSATCIVSLLPRWCTAPQVVRCLRWPRSAILCGPAFRIAHACSPARLIRAWQPRTDPDCASHGRPPTYATPGSSAHSEAHPRGAAAPSKQIFRLSTDFHRSPPLALRVDDAMCMVRYDSIRSPGVCLYWKPTHLLEPLAPI